MNTPIRVAAGRVARRTVTGKFIGWMDERETIVHVVDDPTHGLGSARRAERPINLRAEDADT